MKSRLRMLLPVGLLAASLLASVSLLPIARLAACPFCSAVSQTFSEEMDGAAVVVVAKMTKAPMLNGGTGGPTTAESSKAQFEVTDIIKGAEFLDDSRTINSLYFGDAPVGRHFLIMGLDPPKVAWTTPTPLSDRARDYIKHLPKLPAKGPERLAFFQNYLEDEEEMLSRDAYDEFAKAPYSEVREMKGHMHHDQLVDWIKDQDIPASRRRLYFTMLSVCGSAQDADLIEDMIRSDDRKLKGGLDAMISCLLTLKGEKGLPLVEDQFLKNTEAEYTDTYAAIMALRFHGTELSIVPRDRILKAMHHMLDRPELADLVIPDLARWEDWAVMPRLVELYKKADDDSSWVRVPVLRYLMACPLPEAKKQLDECAKLDPTSMKRASTFFPFVAPSSGGTAASTTPESGDSAGEGDSDNSGGQTGP